MKIILLTPLLQPYRITFYEKLYALFPGLKVFYNVKKKEDGRPGYGEIVNFPATGFKEYKYIIATFGIIWLKGMLKEIKKEKPDVIITQGIPGNITYSLIVNWAHKNNIKIVFWYCGWEPNKKRNKLLLQLKRFIAYRHYHKGDFFLTYSTKAKNELLRSGTESEKIAVAFNGIELDEYKNINHFHTRAAELRKNYAYPDSKVFLYVGGLIPDKRIILLINGFNALSQKHKNVKLWIIGDGPQRTEVENLVKDNENINYFGRIVDGVEPYFIAADFFVLPGTGGLALNQAMFFETPCICARGDGTEDDLVFDGFTGLRFEEDNLDSLLNKLEEAIFLNEDTLQIMKTQGKKLITENSNVNNMIRVFEKTLRQI